jgi:hypothetical protein
MLVHEAYAIFSELARRERQRNICAANLQAASWVRRVKPRQNLDQRRLARTILTEPWTSPGPTSSEALSRAFWPPKVLLKSQSRSAATPDIGG